LLCARCSIRRGESIAVKLTILKCVVVALWGGGGEKDYAYLLRPPIILGLCSPSRHHQRRLRPPAYGSPNKNKTKGNPPPASPIDPMVWAQPHIPHIKYRGRKDTGNLQNKNQTKATRRPSDPFLQKPRKNKPNPKPKPRAKPATLQPKNKPPNVSQSISHVPASSIQASKLRDYCSFIAVSSGVGHGASLGPGCCCCSTSLRASARKAGHDRSVALCDCWHRAQQSGGCAHRRPFGQPGMSHGWWWDRCGCAHTAHAGVALQSAAGWPKRWHRLHCVVSRNGMYSRTSHSRLNSSILECRSLVGPIRVMTMEEAAFSCRFSAVVSHRGVLANFAVG
jgi:hypothetical protein